MSKMQFILTERGDYVNAGLCQSIMISHLDDSLIIADLGGIEAAAVRIINCREAMVASKVLFQLVTALTSNVDVVDAPSVLLRVLGGLGRKVTK